MKGLTFENFITYDTNKAAYDICMQLVTLDKTLPRPIVLLGESSAGKSHLLWSIVNHFRINNMDVGVALISAMDFPAKVKQLVERPEKFKKRPVFLLVDDLHLFDKDMEDLERVLFAVQNHGHIAVLATKIHPNVLPTLSGKLKALLNDGAIIGIKALPKSNGAAIPEAALTHIAALKARIAELEKTAATMTDKPDAEKETARAGQEDISVQLKAVENERDTVRATLERTGKELDELRNNLLEMTKQRDMAVDESNTLKESMAQVMERIEKQRTAYAGRLAAIEEQGEQLSEAARGLSSAPADVQGAGQGAGDAPAEAPAAAESELAKAQQQLAAQAAEIEELRATSANLAAALQRQETEVQRVVEDARETLTAIETTPDDQGQELHGKAQVSLQTIVEQLDTLEGGAPATSETESTAPIEGGSAQQVDDDGACCESAPGGDTPAPDTTPAPAQEEPQLSAADQAQTAGQEEPSAPVQDTTQKPADMSADNTAPDVEPERDKDTEENTA